jgi:hypothetical protein
VDRNPAAGDARWQAMHLFLDRAIRFCDWHAARSNKTGKELPMGLFIVVVTVGTVEHVPH